MPDAEFYIAFIGSPARYAVLARTFDRLRTVKAGFGDDSDVDETAKAIEHDLQTALSAGDTPQADPDDWSLGDIVWNILHGEYQLVRLTFDGSSGRLVYDPEAFPFGGTDPMKALVEYFGFEVTRDSFWDGFAEWRGRK